MSDGSTPYRPRRALPSVVADDDFEDAGPPAEHHDQSAAPRRSSGSWDSTGDTADQPPATTVGHEPLHATAGREAAGPVLANVTPAQTPPPGTHAPDTPAPQTIEPETIEPEAIEPRTIEPEWGAQQLRGEPATDPTDPAGPAAPAGPAPVDTVPGDTVPHRDVAMARPGDAERAAHPNPAPATRVEIPQAPTLQPTASTARPAVSSTTPEPRYTARRSAGRAGRLRPAAGSRHRGRTRVGVIVGAVAAALVIVLTIGYVAFSLNGPATVATQPPVETASSASPSAPAETLSDARLLTEREAAQIDEKATWAVAMTQTGLDEASPVATCLGRPTEAETPAEKTMLRTLSGTGSRTLSVLHQADLYPTKDEAVGIFGDRSRALGGCLTDKAYLESAVLVTDLSNQAIGVTVTLGGATPQYHTVLLVQTGRMVNVLDVATTDKAVDQQSLAAATTGVVNSQCSVAIGLCAGTPKASVVVPPIGGDEPGLPVAADIPMLAGQTGRWTPADITRSPEPVTTSCERYDFANQAGPTARLGRTYILEDDDKVPSTFGVDEVILTMRSEQDATKLAEELRSNLRQCGDRQLTAKVSDETSYDAVGAKETLIEGTSFKVEQQTGDAAVNYRVGVNTAGTKVIYTFLPVVTDGDFTDAQWQAFNVRASQRATQIG